MNLAQMIHEQAAYPNGEESRYAWIVTRDFLAEEFHPFDPDESAVGTTGPHNAPDELIKRLESGEGITWRAYDDDQERYYRGLMIVPEDAEEWEVSGPLRDFAGPGAGAVYMDFRQGGETHGYEY